MAFNVSGQNGGRTRLPRKQGHCPVELGEADLLGKPRSRCSMSWEKGDGMVWLPGGQLESLDTR